MQQPLKADLIISGGTILCMDSAQTVLEDNCIVILKGRIEAIVSRMECNYIADKLIDATDCIVMPGLINAHTHLPMTYFRGLADDLPLHKWLNDYIWPLEAKLLDRDFIYHSSLHGAAEMLRNGITQIQDMYFGIEAEAEACARAGLRAILGEAVADFRIPDEETRNAIGSKALELRQHYSGNDLLDFNLAPHAIYTCSSKTLEKCAQAAADHSLRLHTHLSESQKEAQDCLDLHGCKPVQYLQQVGILQLPAVYAHAIWVDEEEAELLAVNSASIAICTESNLKLASGILPLKSYLDKGVNACFATDGVASNNNLDLLAELDFTAKLHKTINNDPSFLPAHKALHMATLGAAKALRVDTRRGSLEQGKDADICILDATGLHCQPMYNPYSHVVYTLGSRQVRDVLVAGEVLVEHGAFTRLDESEILGSANSYKSRISAELGR